jgi:hypothetical protein
MTPEEKARQRIDAMLGASDWTVQTKDQINLSAARGVAISELAVATGEPDYTLFVDAKAIGTVEAKPEGHSLTGVEEQSTKYMTGAASSLPAWRKPLPFCYESTGRETRFTNRLDPEPRSWNVFAFLQHIFTILKQHGRAAVVMPDNVLFEGGAGETIRRELLEQADVHTLLRLPTGNFYAQGVKANVLFFDRKPAQEKPWTEKLWIYDLRTNRHFTLKENTLKRTDLEEFVACYNPKNRHERKESERFKSFTYDELLKRDKVNLDVFWLKDEALEESANLPPPGIIGQEIADDLEAALEQFATIAEDLK